MGILPTVISLLASTNVKMVNPALRVVGNVLAGDDEQTQMCINNNILKYLEQLLSSSQFSVVKEATWCLSNITAGHEAQIQVVVVCGVHSRSCWTTT